jgi:hypothetical protein
MHVMFERNGAELIESRQDEEAAGRSLQELAGKTHGAIVEGRGPAEVKRFKNEAVPEGA